MRDHAVDAGETDAALEEGGDGDFIGGAQYGGHSAAGAAGGDGQVEAGVAFRRQRLKVQGPRGGDVQTRDGGVGEAFGVEQGILDGQAHTGGAQLGLDGAVVKLHHRMDGALGMHQDGDVVPGDAEEPVGFDDFEGFVHQGCGVDGDFGAHLPGGMAEGLFGGYGVQLVQGGAAEGAAAGGDQEAADVVVLALEALPDGAGFAVHGEDDAAVFGFGGLEHRAGHNDGFLVGEGDLLAGAEGGQGGGQADGAHQGDHYLVDFGQGDHFVHWQQGGAGGQRRRRGGAPDVAGVEFGDLFQQEAGVGAGGEAHYLELVGESPHDVQGLPSDGAGGAQNDDASHRI